MASRIRDVWTDNFEQEMDALRATLAKYTYVAIVCLRRRGGG